VSQITGTGVSCSQFTGGTATTLSTLTYTTRNGLIRSVSPSGFVYWVRVTASAGTNTFVIPQTITTGNFSTRFGLNSTGSNVQTGTCGSVSGETITAAPGNGSFTAQWNAASAGTYIIKLRLSTTAVRNQPVPNPSTVHYEFSTTGVSGSTSGIDLSQ
jgi:O-glycosyl hydrolase